MVSVLFADVRGYTEMSDASSPAQMVDRIGSLQRWAAHEVGRHSGIVDKFAGDAVMATFNVSGQSVDHTLHAVQAAIAIIDKAALIDLPVGAGVAVGPAVVGRLAESANVSVLGGVTNLAAPNPRNAIEQSSRPRSQKSATRRSSSPLISNVAMTRS